MQRVSNIVFLAERAVTAWTMQRGRLTVPGEAKGEPDSGPAWLPLCEWTLVFVNKPWYTLIVSQIYPTLKHMLSIIYTNSKQVLIIVVISLSCQWNSPLWLKESSPEKIIFCVESLKPSNVLKEGLGCYLYPLGITNLLTAFQTLWSLLTTDAVRTEKNNTHSPLRNSKGVLSKYSCQVYC